MKKFIPHLAVFAILASSLSFAQDNMESMKHPNMTKEMREKMATSHEKMAVCLRSDKDLQTCHDEMKKTCNEVMGGECPMMGGMMHKGMMKNGKKKSMYRTE